MKEKEKYYLFIWDDDGVRERSKHENEEKALKHLNNSECQRTIEDVQLIKGNEIPVRKGFIIDEKT